MKFGFRSKGKRQNKPLHTNHQNQLEKLHQSGRFFGVKIHRSSCKACSQLAGKFFSFKDAPKLPVVGCDASVCNCEYLGVTDPRKTTRRRSERDRRNDIRMSMERRFANDRRAKADKWKGFDQ